MLLNVCISICCKLTYYNVRTYTVQKVHKYSEKNAIFPPRERDFRWNAVPCGKEDGNEISPQTGGGASTIKLTY